MKKLVVSISAGRTSAYMAKQLIDRLDMSKYELLFIFANTGKEREETLEFMHEIDKRWKLNTIWVECVTNPTYRKGVSAKVVTYETADRNGKPFEDMVKKHGLPNVAYKHCTRELKTSTIRAYLRLIGWKKYYTAIGIRADEIDRINPKHKKERLIYPLVSMFPTTKKDVNKFWMSQDFDLKLKSYEGNCDCCFKKTDRKLQTIAIENPQLFDWWHEMEVKYGYFIPESRQHKQVNLPIRIFRKNRTVNDIFEESKNLTVLARDESYDINRFIQTSMFDELDVANGCSESCEPF